MCCVFLQSKSTPLHWAVYVTRGRVATVDVLLRYGAAINQTDDVS